jgi:hypothetical protein
MGLIWDWLRLTRSEPPGAAAGDEQAAAIFRAALQQFEELMRAAGAAGPAGRPLPLFYALSQAGRAIVATRGNEQHRGHGLTVEQPADNVLDTMIRPVERGRIPGQFQSVSRVLGSPILADPVALGALFASLPETGNEILLAVHWPRPLSVWLATEPVVPNPGWEHIMVKFDDGVRTPADVTETLRHYPIAAAGRLALAEAYMRLPMLPREPTPTGLAIRMMLQGNIDEVAPQYRVIGRRWLRPAIVGNTTPPNPLMTWWALLFALSMLARYQPVAWAQALNVDSSPVAVALERAMRKAIDALPQLVAEAVFGFPFPMPERAITGAEAPFD